MIKWHIIEMKHFFVFRHKWIPQDSSQWTYYSFVGCLKGNDTRVEVPYIEQKEDGTMEDPYDVRQLITIYELANIGSQASHDIKGDDYSVTIYTTDIQKVREQPQLEGRKYVTVFEDELMNLRNILGLSVDYDTWKKVLMTPISSGVRVRGKDNEPVPIVRYHGTSRRAYHGILQDGLRPTISKGMIGNNLFYMGHYAKALRYSYMDSQRESGIRSDPVLLRYVVFVKPEEILRPFLSGMVRSRDITDADIENIPEKNRWLQKSSDIKKEFYNLIYGNQNDEEPIVGVNRVMDVEPFESFEEARKALLVGDQKEDGSPSRYFAIEGKKILVGNEIEQNGQIKAYEVDGMWIPIRSDGGGVVLRTLTKFPEIGIIPQKNIIRLVGAFEPKQVTSQDDSFIRDPFMLIQQLVSAKKRIDDMPF